MARKDITERLTSIADAARRDDGTDIPLGEEIRAGVAEITELRRLLDGARLWLNAICEGADIDPEQTVLKVRAIKKDSSGEREIAEKALSETLAEIDSALGTEAPELVVE